MELAPLFRQIASYQTEHSLEIKLIRLILPFVIEKRFVVEFHIFDVCAPRLVGNVSMDLDVKVKEVMMALQKMGFVVTLLEHRNFKVTW